MRFLDLFLLFCLLQPSPEMSTEQQELADQNLRKVVTDGRRLNLELLDGTTPRLMQDWAEQLFADLMPLAHWLDSAYGGNNYHAVVKQFYLSLLDPAKTFSGQLLAQLKASQQDNSAFSLALAAKHQQSLLATDYQFYAEAEFRLMAEESLKAQQQIEQQDSVSFDSYLQQYFVENAAQLCDK
jgi:glutamate--cysteine ligase